MGDSCLPVTVVGPESTVRLEGESSATLVGPSSTVHLCLTPTDLNVAPDTAIAYVSSGYLEFVGGGYIKFVE